MKDLKFIPKLVLIPILLGSLLTGIHAADNPPIPDFTAGGKPDPSHDWLLGPTGLRGWMYFRLEDQSAESRQILITAVDKGSPADGIVQVNDVILGAFGKPFADDARKSFGHAIAAAEEKTGILPLLLWRDGKSSTVELKLQVLGAYSSTAPYDCPKSRNIFEQGCRLIAEKGLANTDIPDHLNALALLASGDDKYRPMLDEYAKKVAASLQNENVWNWYIAYGNLFLSEFALATGNKSAFPELTQVSARGVRNQCMNGMWGHAPPLPDGHSEGYGGMNVIGLPMTISLALARQAGIRDAAMDKAIDKSAAFLRYFVDKGAVPYGDHLPWAKAHDDNGKSSCAAVMFDILGDREAATFNSWMATAAYDGREQGHCGNFWNMLWALPGVSRSGPLATGAYLKEQAWYYDLARNWKGGFVYQKVAIDEYGSYSKWDLTGAYLMSFGLYQKSLYILGKKPSVAPVLNGDAVNKLIAAGRDRFPEGERNGYFKRKDEELIEGLKSWSPCVRHHSALAIGKRGGDFAPTLLEMLAGKDRYARYGAVEALGRLGKAASPALPQLYACLKESDGCLQYVTSEALARIGDKASVGELFAMSLRPSPNDSRRMHQRPASRALFAPYPGNREPASLLANSLEGVDTQQLLPVLDSLLRNDDSVVRASVVPVLSKLSDRDLAPLLPTLVKAVETLAPTNEMWGDDIRISGLDILSRRHISEGMHLCVSSIQWRWGLKLKERMEILSRYGKNARVVLPELRKLAGELASRENPQKTSEKSQLLTKTISAIEASNEEPKLVTLAEFTARSSKGTPAPAPSDP